MEFFKIKHNGNDLSFKLKDFGTPAVALTLTGASPIEIAYRKPFKQLFIELDEKNQVGGELKLEVWNGTGWALVHTTIDETEDFTKSGFIFFEKPSYWKEDDGIFKARIYSTVDHANQVEVRGIGVLLSNDLDLEGVRSNIVSKLNDGKSWVVKHEQARKDIIQLLRNRGNRVVRNGDKYNQLVTEGIRFADLTEFDLLEPTQLRQASLYKVLSMIYLDELSDSEEDKWERQGWRYYKRFTEMMNVFYLQIDVNDDGVASDGETQNVTSTGLVWN